MREIMSVTDLEETVTAQVLVVACAFHPSNGPCSALLPTLENLAVVSTGVCFVTVDVSKPGMLPWVRRLGISKTPSMAYIVRGEVMERTSGSDMDSILKTLRKWYCKVYAVVEA